MARKSKVLIDKSSRKMVEESLKQMKARKGSEGAAKAKSTQKKEPKAPREGTKMERAFAVFTEMEGQSRKDVIARFISDIGLTKAGANTYYQSIKNKAVE